MAIAVARQARSAKEMSFPRVAGRRDAASAATSASKGWMVSFNLPSQSNPFSMVMFLS